MEPTRKHKVIYADNSLELGKACEDLSWNHCPSTPHRPETNRIAERVELLQHCCNQVCMKNGGRISWNVSAICDTIQDPLSDGRTPYERRFGEPIKEPIIPFGSLIEYHPISATDLSRLKVLPGVLLGYVLYARRIWKGDIMFADIEELEKMDASETRAKRFDAKKVITPQIGDFQSATEKKVKLLGGDQVLRTSTLIRDNPERGEVHEDLRGESDGSPPPTRQDSTHGDGSHCNQCSLLRAVFRIVCRNADIYLRGNLLFHDLINQVMLRSLQHGIVIFGIINAFVYDHNFHRHNVYNPARFEDCMEERIRLVTSITPAYAHAYQDICCTGRFFERRRGVNTSKCGQSSLMEELTPKMAKPWLDGALSSAHLQVCITPCLTLSHEAHLAYAGGRLTPTILQSSRVWLKHSPSWDLLDPSLVECRLASLFFDSRHAANICMGSIQSRANVQLGLMS